MPFGAEQPPSSQEAGPAPPSQESVRAALDRIVASEDFAASDRARRFLRYVVDETLAGRADRIKAFSVAVEVFGRDESFDPQNDPVVRIEAGRLRRAMEHYYLLSGKDDPVVIEIPKGGYVPTFTARPVEPAETPSVEPVGVVEPVAASPAPPRSKTPWLVVAALLVLTLAGLVAALLARTTDGAQTALRAGPAVPQVLVLPFTNLGEGELAALYSASLTDEVVTALGSFKEIAVLGVQTSRSIPADPDVAKLHDEYGIQYVLEGSVRANADTVRVSIRVTSSKTGAVLWSRIYENALNPNDLFALPAKTAGEVAAAVAQPYGIVFQAESENVRQAPPNDLEAYLCTLSYYTYRAAISPEGYAAVKSCLEQAVAEFPEYATAWALLAHIYIDEIRTGFSKGDKPAARALEAARTAVRLDPENVRALQALATALFFDHKLDEAFKVADRALALNPNDTELLGQVGQLKGQSGQTEEGRALLERALARNPGHSGFYRGVLAVTAYVQGDYATALQEIEQTDMRRLPLFHAVAAIIYAQNGMIEEGKAEIAQFQEMAPGFIPNLWAELAKRNIPEHAQARMVEGLEKLGVTIPPQSERDAAERADSG